MIRLGGLSVSRLLVGGNPISGFSHQSGERSEAMLSYFSVARIKALLQECERRGVTGIVARADAFIVRVLREYWDDGGQIRWIAQTAPEYGDAVRNIEMARNAGASAIYLHGGEVDRMMDSGRRTDVLTTLRRIAETGLPTGMAAHVPHNHVRLQDAGAPLDFHMVCLYNITGYRGVADSMPAERFENADRAAALRTLAVLQHPAVLYKVYGAGRLTPDEAYGDIVGAIRPGDGVCVGMFPPDAADIVEQNVRRVALL